MEHIPQYTTAKMATGRGYLICTDADPSFLVATLSGTGAKESTESIVRACNLYDELVHALVEARDYIDGAPTGLLRDRLASELEAVLAKVKGV